MAADGQALAVPEETPEQKEQADLLQKILERLDEAPRKGARIVQEWLENEEKEPVPEAA
jgi:flagellar biosynthesis/type III secretory pathway M-ring protein FliF/YscJ